MRRIWALIPLVIAAGCGGGDDPAPTPGEKACQDLAAHLKTCGLVQQNACDPTQPCAMGCYVQADCTQLAAAPTGTFLSCLGTCTGLGPDPFVCKDGREFVNKAARCDKSFDCHDGSDEANCADAGTP